MEGLGGVEPVIGGCGSYKAFPTYIQRRVHPESAGGTGSNGLTQLAEQKEWLCLGVRTGDVSENGW
jgi:hypothetical protein